MTHAEESILIMYFSRIDEILNDTTPPEQKVLDIEAYTIVLMMALKIRTVDNLPVQDTFLEG